jgi:hypothetical protein
VVNAPNPPVEHIVYVNDHEHERAVLSNKNARIMFALALELFRAKPDRSTVALYVLRREGYYEMIERRTVGGAR